MLSDAAQLLPFQCAIVPLEPTVQTSSAALPQIAYNNVCGLVEASA
jgi:hypothetical protein